MVRTEQLHLAEQRDARPSAEFRDVMARLIDRAGPIAADAMEQLVSGRIDLDEFDAEIESAPDFESFQSEVLSLLELYGVTEQTKYGRSVDIEALTSLSQGLFYVDGSKAIRARQAVEHFDNDEDLTQARAILRHIQKEYGAYMGENHRQLLFNAFRGLEVYAADELEAALRADTDVVALPQKKSLFLDPPLHPDRAYALDSLRSQTFHIAPWDIKGPNMQAEEAYSDFHPTLRFEEVMLATEIYHPTRGDGQRDEAGRLWVYDERSEQRRPITQEWLRNRSLTNRNNSESSIHQLTDGSAGRAISEGLFLELSNRSLLLASDFEQMHGSTPEERRIVQKNGMVTLDGIRYTLGNSYGDGNYSAVKISSEHYGIVKKGKHGETIELSAILDTLDPSVGTKTANTGGSDYVRIGKGIIDEHNALRPYDSPHPELFLPRHDGETDEAYQERAGAVLAFGDLIALRRELQNQTGVSIDGLNPDQQHGVVQAYQYVQEHGKEQQLFDFVKTYGVDGLQSLASIEFNSATVDTLLSIMDTGKTRADVIEVFRKYNELLSLTQDVSTRLKEFFVEDREVDVAPIVIESQISKKAARLIEAYGQGKGIGLTVQEINAQLEELRADVVLFSSICNSVLKDPEADVQLKDIAGLTIHLGAVEDETIRDEYIAASQTNFAGRPQITKKLEHELDDPQMTFLTVSRSIDAGDQDKKEFVSGLSIRETDKGSLYVDNFNVDLQYASSGLGRVVLRHMFDEVQGNRDVEATCVPTTPVGSFYVETLSAVATGYEIDVPDTPYGRFNIRKDSPEKNISYLLKSKSQEELVSTYIQEYADHSWETDIGKDVLLVAINSNTDVANIPGMMDRLLNVEGYTMSRMVCLNGDCSSRLCGFEKNQS